MSATMPWSARKASTSAMPVHSKDRIVFRLTCGIEIENYLMLFDQSTGYLVLISGESDIETLEHIAYEMEIRESSSPRIEYTGGVPIGAIDLARG